MNLRAGIFRENSEKRHPIDFFDLQYTVFLYRIYVFLAKYGHDSRGFFYTKFETNYMRALFFLKKGRFLTKWCMGEVCFLEKDVFENKGYLTRKRDVYDDIRTEIHFLPQTKGLLIFYIVI